MTPACVCLGSYSALGIRSMPTLHVFDYLEKAGWIRDSAGLRAIWGRVVSAASGSHQWPGVRGHRGRSRPRGNAGRRQVRVAQCGGRGVHAVPVWRQVTAACVGAGRRRLRDKVPLPSWKLMSSVRATGVLVLDVNTWPATTRLYKPWTRPACRSNVGRRTNRGGTSPRMKLV